MIYRFGPYRFDATTGELFRDARKVRLAPQPARALQHLVEQGGRLVTRDDLIGLLWEDGVSVDYDAGLNSTIKQVRRALRDEAATPRFLETLPRRGYRFIAPISTEEHAAQPSVPEPAVRERGLGGASDAAPASGRQGRSWLRPAMAVAAVGVLALMLWKIALPAGDLPESVPETSATSALAADAYFKGQYVLDSEEEASGTRAAAFFRRALEVQPDHLPAQVGLARSVMRQAFGAEDRGPLLRDARQRAEEVLDQDPDTPWALVVRAQTRLMLDWDWEGAEADYRAAVAGAPDDARLHHAFAYFLSSLGAHDEAVREIGIARELDPLSPVINLDSAWVYFYARRYEEAIREAQRALELQPDTFAAHYCLQDAYSRLGRPEDGFRHGREMMRLAGADPAFLERLSRLDGAERSEELRQWWTRARLEQGELEVGDAPAWGIPVYVHALIALSRGDRQQALQHLERSVELPEPSALVLAVDPRVDALREEPGFTALLETIGRAG
ncbi:hypothetical protein ABI59_05950 [Acidobacteria bacterium Mor1]|nr:hypothetical protein ABI59_05950 [Acidobacteria bacterium Mor1]